MSQIWIHLKNKIIVLFSINFYTCKKRNVSPDYFTGNVVIKEVYDEKNSKEQEVYFVEFQNGSLTTIHYHETEQILIPVYGKGIVGELKNNSILDFTLDDIELNFLDVGDVVSIRPNVFHFHGALPQQNFTHIAFRKLFDYDYSNNDKIPKMTQTKWLIDFISDKLESNDSDLIKSTLQQISNKVNQSIANIIT